MARVAFATRAIDEAGNAIATGIEVRVYDDFGASVATVVTDDSGGGTSIAQPITPNSGQQTTLAVTTGAGDTTLTVASTSGFAVGQYIPIYDGTNTKYRFIRSILSGPPRLTIESAIGVVFSNTNTSVGNPDMAGVVAGYVPDTTFHYIQVKDVASTRLMPPTLVPTMIGIQSLAILEEGAAAGTRPTLNFISPFITATDNAPSTRVDVTGPTAAVPAIVLGTAAAAGAATTIIRSDATIAAFDATVPATQAFGDAAATGSAAFAARRDHKHAMPTFGDINLVTEVATTSGTSIDFTGIPSGVKRITVMLNGVSLNNTAEVILQLGDSGGVETTTYLGTTGIGVAYSTGFSAGASLGASATLYGVFTLTLQDSSDNTWMCVVSIGEPTTGVYGAGAGRKATSATLDRVRLTTIAGTATFDAGVMSISYE